MKIKVGDSVRVNEGVSDPDFPQFSIAGWQGRVTELIDGDDIEEPMISIEWDSITLNSYTEDYLAMCDEEGLDLLSMNLPETELQVVQPRDTLKDVQAAIERLEDLY